MTQQIQTPSHRDERGMATAEYAVGTVGACSIGGILVQIAQSKWFNDFITGFLDKATSVLPF